MTAPLHVSLVQVGYGDDESTADRVSRVAEMLESVPSSDLVVLPELWASGGFAFDAWSVEDGFPNSSTVRRLAQVAARRNFWVHCGTFIEGAAAGADRGPEGRGLWNTAVLVSPEGEVSLTYRKIHRFGFGDGEALLLEAGSRLALLDARFGQSYMRVGLATCYDLRFPEMFRSLARNGVGLTIVPAAWPLARVAHWQLLGQARAVENQAWMLQCNTAGTHRGLTMGGHSQVVAPTGEVVGALGIEEGVLSLEIDLDLVTETRQGFPVLQDQRAVAWSVRP